MTGEETYSDEVIQILTNRVGYILGRAIRLKYYDLRDKLLHKVQYHSDFSALETQIAIDIIALSAFHETIVVPFYGSSNFLGRLAEYEISRVQMGTYTLSREDYNNMDRCTRAFYAVLKKCKMTPSFLSIPSIDDLIERIANPPTEQEENNE